MKKISIGILFLLADVVSWGYLIYLVKNQDYFFASVWTMSLLILNKTLFNDMKLILAKVRN